MTTIELLAIVVSQKHFMQIQFFVIEWSKNNII